MRAVSGWILLERLGSFRVQSLPVRDLLERIRSYHICRVRALHGRDLLEWVRGDRFIRVQPVSGWDILWWDFRIWCDVLF